MEKQKLLDLLEEGVADLEGWENAVEAAEKKLEGVASQIAAMREKYEGLMKVVQKAINDENANAAIEQRLGKPNLLELLKDANERFKEVENTAGAAQYDILEAIALTEGIEIEIDKTK